VHVVLPPRGGGRVDARKGTPVDGAAPGFPQKRVVIAACWTGWTKRLLWILMEPTSGRNAAWSHAGASRRRRHSCAPVRLARFICTRMSDSIRDRKYR